MTPATCKTCGEPCEGPVLPPDLSHYWRERLLRWPVECPACAEAGEEEERRKEAERRAQEAERQARERAQRISAWREESGIPSRWRGRAWDELEYSSERAAPIGAASAWGRGELLGLVLVGSVGVGKTQLAATAAWSRLKRGPLTWVSAPALFKQLDRKFGSDEYEHALSIVTATTALVLDDLDKVRASERAAENIYVAIDGRINAGAALLVTANMTLGALGEKFPEHHGEAIVSRLAGYCETFLLEGEDRRLERRRAA